ncbi:tyrosine-type recombinase/integrase [Streptomyces sp. NBC_01005]|uniref:tyrosine-type recombinase/integrase n=1 Tax=unclassified Streptomyces TaxID=2593676 RepID=UPI00386B3F85|nr:tyrosine-type recombinase/integrase [Streptomyces sp. NBC_01005]WTC98756.1 tyrosine-type recombinase/integrase [Streptomyces sp. NBC_01650]
MVRRIALAADIERFSTHTTRHLCLTDLARMGWELHEIATFAGHRQTDSTLQYIHLSGRELADKLRGGMEHIHAWRVQTLAGETPSWVRRWPGDDAPSALRRRGRPVGLADPRSVLRPAAAHVCL